MLENKWDKTQKGKNPYGNGDTHPECITPGEQLLYPKEKPGGAGIRYDHPIVAHGGC